MVKVTLAEAKKLVSLWSKGTFPTIKESIKYHLARHGKEVSADDVWDYLRKAEGFSKNLRNAKKSEPEFGVTRYMKSGNYVIKDGKGKILSFGNEL
jgi:hypothetical protein